MIEETRAILENIVGGTFAVEWCGNTARLTRVGYLEEKWYLSALLSLKDHGFRTTEPHPVTGVVKVWR